MYKGVDSTFDCVHTQVRDIVLCAGKYYTKHKKATECCVGRHTQGGNSIYIFATLLASLSSLDMLFSPCVLSIGVCKIAIHSYTL